MDTKSWRLVFTPGGVDLTLRRQVFTLRWLVFTLRSLVLTLRWLVLTLRWLVLTLRWQTFTLRWLVFSLFGMGSMVRCKNSIVCVRMRKARRH